MRSRKLLSLIVWLLLLVPVFRLPAQQTDTAKYPTGLIVTAIVKGSPAEQAGLQAGDLLLSIDGQPIRFDSQVGPLRDRLNFEGRKTVPVMVRRGTQEQTLTFQVALRWGLAESPPLPVEAQALYEAAHKLPAGQSVAAAGKWRAAAEAATKAGDLRAAAWLWQQTYLSAPVDSPEQQEALGQELTSAEQAGDVLLQAEALLDRGNVAFHRGRLDEAEGLYRQALAIQEKLAPNSLYMANTFLNLGNVALVRGKLDEAEGYYKRDLAITEKLAPNSLDMANTFSNLGIVADNRGRLDEAEGLYRQALAIRQKLAPNSLELANTFAGLGSVAYSWGKLDEAEGLYRQALAIREKLAPNSLALAWTFKSLGSVARQRGKLDEAEGYLRQALAIREKLAPNSLALASTFTGLGLVAEERGKLDEAEGYFKKDLVITEKLAPNSLDLAVTLYNLGNVAYQRGRLDEAEGLYRQALAIQEKLAPNSLYMANTFLNLGNVALVRGKLDEAEGYYKRDLAITEKLAPNSLDMANTFSNLGIVADNRGRLDEAEGLYRQALAIRQKLAPNSLALAWTFKSLGSVAYSRGKLDEAEGLYRQALAIREKLAPNSLDVAGTFNSLGIVAYSRGKLDEAEGFHRQALVIREKLAPGSLDMANTFTNLGLVANDRGKLDEAEGFHRHALAIKEKLAPGSLDLAWTFNSLGLVAYDRGKLDEAKGLYRQALALRGKLTPGSLELAATVNNLGRVAWKRGKLDEAERLYSRAWQIVRSQGSQVAGDSGRQAFGQFYSWYAANLLSIQLKRDRPQPAFVTLEQGRGQALQQALSERGITEKVTPKEVWQAYQQTVDKHHFAFKESERSYKAVTEAQAKLKLDEELKYEETALKPIREALAAAEQTFALKRAEEIQARAEMESRWSEVRKAASLALPAPLDPEEARKKLPAGTLLLEFSVGDKEVVLFVISSESVQAFTLPAKREQLEARVTVIRRIVAQEADDRGVKPVSSVADIGQEALRALFGSLFPAEAQAAIAKAKHIVISPDAFLWDLPFAALITNNTGAPVYFGIEKPLSYAQSLTLLLTPAPVRDSAGPQGLALIVGNPLYDNRRRQEMIAQARSRYHSGVKNPAPVALAPKPVPPLPGSAPVNVAKRSGELALLTRNGETAPQLPGSWDEADAIAALYRTRAHTNTKAHTDVEPTEAWFRLNAPKARILHLATHGRFVPYASQSSGVLLAVPDLPQPFPTDNDGALQAWEVWDLKLNADLVILSACETGRGAKVTGEGLIGLTRAWQYAGARTIVSSQWKVEDNSTAVLMVAFHKHLLAGVERDEALRMAMAEVAADKQHAWSDPYHWAAFLMVGETGKLSK